MLQVIDVRGSRKQSESMQIMQLGINKSSISSNSKSKAACTGDAMGAYQHTNIHTIIYIYYTYDEPEDMPVGNTRKHWLQVERSPPSALDLLIPSTHSLRPPL